MTARAAIYARFSSDKQSDRSIDDQVALCRNLCARESFVVVAVYDDRAISGASTLNRLGLQRLLRDARNGLFDVVVTEALDRVSRDQADLAGIFKRLEFHGIAIHTAQDGLAGDIHVGVKGLLGAMYLKDLAAKTRRGQAGVVSDGRHNGGRSFGYRAIPGRKGELEIDETEAAIVRRIFVDYLDGHSPRGIAAALNAASIAGPRGGIWNASTITGSRKRLNGILQNELYVGRIVWNRQTFVKDPDTGKRVSRENSRALWITAAAPHLRIVDQETFDKVAARRLERGGEKKNHTVRPTHLLSGLLKCGCCGSGYIVSGTGKRGSQLRCSRMRESGSCDNRTPVYREDIEARVMKAIETQLAAPELIGEYVREYHRAMREAAAGAGETKRRLEERLAEVIKTTNKVVDHLIAEEPTRALRERLRELEAEREQIEAQLATAAPAPLAFHPNAANIFRNKVRQMKEALAELEDDSRQRVFGYVREMVEKIVIHPQNKKAVDLEIHGHMAKLLRLSEASPEQLGGELVAGTGFEPVTFRL